MKVWMRTSWLPLVTFWMGFGVMYVRHTHQLAELSKDFTAASTEHIIRFDQLAKIHEDDEAELKTCRMVEAGDETSQDTRTILIDQNHPYGSGQLFGDYRIANFDRFARPAGIPGPIWVIPRRIVPQVVDGILGGVYGYALPNGKIDGWYAPQRAQ